MKNFKLLTKTAIVGYILLCVVTFSCTTTNTIQDYTINNDTIIINKVSLYNIKSINDSIYSIQRVE